jgi:splicing factor 3A subunit 2
MDFQNRGGNTAGGGGVAGWSETNVDRRERLRRLAMETIDLSKDPYFMKNHLGYYECRLCLTLHTNEGSYLAHTQGKKHQTNLARRNSKDVNAGVLPAPVKKIEKKKVFHKIGRPGYKITKLKDADTLQRSILFEVEYLSIAKDCIPRYRIMSCFEQKKEAPDEKYQYVIFAAEPYENIAFKIPNLEIDNAEDKYICNWNEERKIYTVQLYFRERKVKSVNPINSINSIHSNKQIGAVNN